MKLKELSRVLSDILLSFENIDTDITDEHKNNLFWMRLE